MIKKSNLLKIIIILIFILAVSELARVVFEYHKLFAPEYLILWMKSFGKLTGIVYVLIYALNIIFPFPTLAILTLAPGLIFGKFWGAVILYSGSFLGANLAFFLARFVAKSTVERFIQGRAKRLDDALEKNGFLTVLLFRIFPIVPSEVTNYAAGLSKIIYRDFFIATMLGSIPGVIIAAVFGNELKKLEYILHYALSYKFVLTTILIILIILVPLGFRYFRKMKN